MSDKPSSECDHIVMSKSGMEGCIYRMSDLDWALPLGDIYFQFCPICGHKHDWNLLIGASAANKLTPLGGEDLE